MGKAGRSLLVLRKIIWQHYREHPYFVLVFNLIRSRKVANLVTPCENKCWSWKWTTPPAKKKSYFLQRWTRDRPHWIQVFPDSYMGCEREAMQPPLRFLLQNISRGKWSFRLRDFIRKQPVTSSILCPTSGSTYLSITYHDAPYVWSQA